MTRQTLTTLAATGSFALLASAFLFQVIGYPPCAMCLWQRWPHAAAIVIGIAAFVLPARILAALGALATATTAGIGMFHTGVERDWWEGPTSCTGAGDRLAGLSGDSLLSLDNAGVVMCDEVSWQLFGLSMASWNVVFSLALLGVWIAAALAPTRR